MRARRASKQSRLTPLVTLVLAAVFAFAGSAAVLADAKIAYPDTKRGDQVDDYHGTKVPDPYRWLEQDPRVSSEVSGWITAELADWCRRLGVAPPEPSTRPVAGIFPLWTFSDGVSWV